MRYPGVCLLLFSCLKVDCGGWWLGGLWLMVADCCWLMIFFLLLSKKNLWPTFTTRKSLTEEISEKTFRKERRRLQAKHLWMKVKLSWNVLADRMYTAAPTGKSREQLYALLFNKEARPPSPPRNRITISMKFIFHIIARPIRSVGKKPFQRAGYYPGPLVSRCCCNRRHCGWMLPHMLRTSYFFRKRWKS